ncbi:MAG: NAD-dependent deacylase [Corynebacterium sp.]|uniref:SIR2 family NAD-dependent protein deacylase n=1 Tax=Corynebacterium sp. TaxID=1720 RepID=UPI0026DD7CD0|nr:NAD-dependent deacylase [Corynebacterium sp.]MDO5099511.1 NAD-dependent deacylase [Corynebacterium sp.]
MNRRFSADSIAQCPLDFLRLLRQAKRVHVFSGAGMSAESGLDTYRNDETGLWENVDPQAMASISAWRTDPEPMWAWYLWRAHLAAEAQPNAGHVALARWAQLVPEFHVTTQNIDNLHERAGQELVSHLHGSLFAWRCTDCDAAAADISLVDAPIARLTPPACEFCGGLIRPGVVWFGEALPEDEWLIAQHWMMNSDVVVIVGTSGVVQPAASLPLVAYRLGIPIVEISPAETELSPLCAFSWASTAAVALPMIAQHLENL